MLNKNKKLEGKIIYTKDLLDKRKNEKGGKRFYLITKDEKRNIVEIHPITSRINKYGNDEYPEVKVNLNNPNNGKLPLDKNSVVLTEEEFKKEHNRLQAINELRDDIRIQNLKEIFQDLKKRYGK